ncbi:MAG TPA: hypothetical protein P5287_03000, partial [bacterium]|nr:hypothetical protein [bacterium]
MNGNKILICVAASIILHVAAFVGVFDLLSRPPALSELPMPLWAKGNCMLDVDLVSAGSPDGAKRETAVTEVPDLKVAAAGQDEDVSTAPEVAPAVPEPKGELAAQKTAALRDAAVEQKRRDKRRQILLRRKSHFKKMLAAAVKSGLMRRRAAAQR